jgi:hypothetical protein
MTSSSPLLVALLLALPTTVPALAPPLGISLETVVSPRPGGGRVGLTAGASCWLSGGLEAEARLAFGSADRPGGRAAAGVSPALGLRWVPDLGHWRPLAGVEAGLRFAGDGASAAPTAAGRGGVEFLALRQLSIVAAAGWRWSASGGTGPELLLGLAYRP